MNTDPSARRASAASRAGYTVSMGTTAPTAPPESLPQHLLRAVRTHVASEEESLTEYQHMVDTTPDPVVKLLMRLLLEDEKTHHRLLKRIAVSLSDELQWTRSSDALPAGAVPSGGNAETIARLREWIRHESEDARHMRRAAKQNSDLYSGLFTLLMEAMAADSQKHERFLRFILRRMETAKAERNGG